MSEQQNSLIIGVIGAGECDQEVAQTAYDVGKRIAEHGHSLICGGLGGVMEEASHGAHEAGGTVIGVLPGYNKADANPYVHIPIATGLGHARNVIIASTADALIAVSGSHGTLSEIAFGLKLGKPVIGLDTWDIGENINKAQNPEEAIILAEKLTGWAR